MDTINESLNSLNNKKLLNVFKFSVLNVKKRYEEYKSSILKKYIILLWNKLSFFFSVQNVIAIPLKIFPHLSFISIW